MLDTLIQSKTRLKLLLRFFLNPDTSAYLRGLDSKVVDVTLIGIDIDDSYLARLVEKAEELIGRKIRTLTYESDEHVKVEFPRLLIYGVICE